MARLGVIGLALLCIMLAFSHLPVGVDHVVRFTRPAKLKVSVTTTGLDGGLVTTVVVVIGRHCTRSFSNRSSKLHNRHT